MGLLQKKVPEQTSDDTHMTTMKSEHEVVSKGLLQSKVGSTEEGVKASLVAAVKKNYEVAIKSFMGAGID
jgi:hypothetical protein